MEYQTFVQIRSQFPDKFLVLLDYGVLLDRHEATIDYRTKDLALNIPQH